MEKKEIMKTTGLVLLTGLLWLMFVGIVGSIFAAPLVFGIIYGYWWIWLIFAFSCVLDTLILIRMVFTIIELREK